MNRMSFFAVLSLLAATFMGGTICASAAREKDTEQSKPLPPSLLTGDSPVVWWSSDQDAGRHDAILGHHELVAGVSGKALRSDEFETAIVCLPQSAPRLTSGAFAVEAWVAPRAFAWNYCPIITQRDESNGFYFGINYQGQLQLHASPGGKWIRCESRTALPGLNEGVRFASENRSGGGKVVDFGDARPNPSVPLLMWTHVAGSLDTNGTLRIFINGEPAGETKADGAFAQAANTKLVLARTTEPVLPLFLARPPANAPHFCSFDGLLDEIKIYDHALSSDAVREHFRSLLPANPQPLHYRRMPTAQDSPGAFGAFYTRFKYDEDWDRTRRFGELQDVFVRFENNPCTFVCWNGTMYPIFYPDGGKVGQQFEAFETWDGDGCHEAMMDRQSKYSTWRIIENTSARVILHWRHALVSYNGRLINTDANTGWSDWVDDEYTIYPDTVCARQTTLWSSKPEANHSYAQDNSVIATCAQQGRSVFEFLKQSVIALFNGEPPPALLPAPTG